MIASSLAILASALVTVVTPTEDRYQCLDPDGLVVATGSRLTTTRNQCIELSEAYGPSTDGRSFTLSRTETILTTTAPPTSLVWVVAPLSRGTDRPVYAFDDAAQRTRGARLGRSYPYGIGRCEGPLDEPWGTSTKQWQYTTTPDGQRGLTYCKLMEPLGPAPEPVPVPEPEPVPEPVPVGWLADINGTSGAIRATFNVSGDHNDLHSSYGDGHIFVDAPDRMVVYTFHDALHARVWDKAGDMHYLRSRFGVLDAGDHTIEASWDSENFALIVDGKLELHYFEWENAGTALDVTVRDGVEFVAATEYDACTASRFGRVDARPEPNFIDPRGRAPVCNTVSSLEASSSACDVGVFVTWSGPHQPQATGARLFLDSIPTDVPYTYEGGYCYRGLSPEQEYTLSMVSYNNSQVSKRSDSLVIKVL